ncbi:transposase, partial [Mycoplasmopsis mucosicanis]
MKNLIVMMMGNGKARYCRVVKSNGFAKGIKNVISLGSESKLSAINERYLEIFREKIKEISDNTEPKTIKKMMLDHLCSLKEKNFITNIGINIFYDVIKKLEIFSSLKKSKHKNLEELLKYQIASRILQNTSIIKSFETKDNYLNDIESKKDTFYSLLDVLYENEIEIVKNLNNKIAEMTSRN